MSSQRSLGEQFERVATHFLTTQGCKLVEQNYSCRLGEIDAVVLDKQTLVFVEVKYRTKQFFGHPAESVTKKKQLKIIRAAQHFLQKNKKYSTYDARFDIISISQHEGSREPDIQWIKGAFTT